MGRALIIALYYTGARPVEILQIRGKDVKSDKAYITVFVRGSKRGLPRNIPLPRRLPMVKELYNYAMGCFPEMYIFFKYQNKYTRHYTRKNGEQITRFETTDKLRYYFKKWFDPVIQHGISPYFLRHNRFSKLAHKGLEMEQIRLLKGGKTITSVSPYLHMSSHSFKKIAKKID
jgi:site-specific recombinase XerD